MFMQVCIQWFLIVFNLCSYRFSMQADFLQLFQVFSGSQFQNNVVSNTEGSSSFFTHGSGGGGLISPSSNAGQNADRSSRGGDSNESSPHGVNSGSNSPHLRLVFGHISIQQKSKK